MKYTMLGRTGMRVSRICLGCMSYGTSTWRPWVLDEADSMPFFRQAIQAGINFFDTADMYSLGVSEEVTGKALKEFANRDEIVIATKVFFPMTSGPNMGGLSRKHIQQACEASLRRLGVDCIHGPQGLPSNCRGSHIRAQNVAMQDPTPYLWPAVLGTWRRSVPAGVSIFLGLTPLA